MFAGVLLGGGWGYAAHLAGFDRLAHVDGDFVLHRRFPGQPRIVAAEAIEDVRLKLPPKSGEEGAGVVLYTAVGRYESVSMPLSEARDLRRRVPGCRAPSGQ